MSLPEGKAIYLIAFNLPLVLYTQTHRPARHPYSLLFINVNFHSAYLHISFFFHYICAVILTHMFNI